MFFKTFLALAGRVAILLTFFLPIFTFAFALGFFGTEPVAWSEIPEILKHIL